VRHKSRYSLIISIVLMSITALCFAQLGGGVGQEMKQIEKQIANPNADTEYQRQTAPPKISIEDEKGGSPSVATNSTNRLDQKEKKSFLQKLLFWKKSESESGNKSTEPAIYVPKYSSADQVNHAEGVTKKSLAKEPLRVITPVYDAAGKKPSPEKQASKKAPAALTVVKPEYAASKAAGVVVADSKKTYAPVELTVVTPEYAKAESKEAVAKSDPAAKPAVVKPVYAKAAPEVSPDKNVAKNTQAPNVATKRENAQTRDVAIKKDMDTGSLAGVPVYAKATPVEVVVPPKREQAEAKDSAKEIVVKNDKAVEPPVFKPVYAKAAQEEVSAKEAHKVTRVSDALPVVTPVYAKNETPTDAVKYIEAEAPQTVSREDVLLSRIHLTLEGDGTLLEDAGLLKQLKLDLATISSDSKRSAEDKQAAVKTRIEECNKKLVGAGYYLASLWLLDSNIDKSEFSVFVDAGRIRETKFYDAAKSADAGATKKDFSQKYFSEEQLRRKMVHIQPGQIFNYNDFRSDIFSINSSPDVMLDADLRVSKEIVDGKLRRYVDTDYMVKESAPLHAVLSLDNSGTDATGDWGAGLTVQDLNLTKHDDVLSVNVPVSVDGSLKSASGSYYLPYGWKNGGAYTLFGGYSDMYTKNFIKDFDQEGKGYFTGAQMSYKLTPESKKHALEAAAGITYRNIKTTTYYLGAPLPVQEVTMVPLAFTLSYSSLQPGFFGGRNFFTAQTVYHHPGFLGASDDEGFIKQRANAKAEYWIEKLQGARLQPLFGQKGSDGSVQDQWVLFLKGDAQIASGTLVPAEQMGVGGATTVRGYKERENLGDNAFVGTVELRTPLLLGMISSPFLSAKEKEDRKLDPVDYLQFLTFFDYGYVEYADPQPGESPSDSIYSVGVGVRMSLTKHSQMSFDYGIPLTTTENDDGKNGRFHLNVKFQF